MKKKTFFSLDHRVVFVVAKSKKNFHSWSWHSDRSEKMKNNIFPSLLVEKVAE